MEYADRRWLRWAILSLLLVVNLASAGFLAFWYVVWPVSPRFVIQHSPWTVPFVRAYAALDDSAASIEISKVARSRFRQMETSHQTEIQSGLVTCMRDHDSDVRWAALDLINGFEEVEFLNPELRDEILRLTKDENDGVRRQACSAVLYFPQDEAERILIDLFDEGDKYVQLIAVHHMAKLGDHRLSKKIIPLLQDPRVDVRRWAVQLIAYTRDPEAIPAVTLLRKDEDEETRIWAARFLRDVNTPVGVDK